MKSVFASKVIWLNLLSLVAMVLSLPEVSGLLTPTQVPYVAAIVAAVNIVLRWFATSEPVSLTGKKE